MEDNVQNDAASTPKLMGMFLQDPALPELHQNYAFSLDRDYLNKTGSSRFLIRDTDENDLPMFSGLNWADESDLSFEHFEDERIDNPQFHQVNTFAVVNRTLDLIEEELGHTIAWRDGGPLIIRPHAFEGMNAYYSSEPQSLNFGYFSSPFRRAPVWTCLSHDVVAHELGHAILDTLRPLFLYSFELDVAALHESLSDLLAMFAALSHPEIVKQLYSETQGNMRHPSLISRLAEEFGVGVSGVGVPYLRSALEGPSYSMAPKEPHARSTVWTAAMYEILEKLIQVSHPSGFSESDDGFDEFVQALVEAGVWLKGMLFRAFNYMPPSGVTMPMLARLMYEADARVYPNDSKFRDIAKDVFVARELWNESLDLRSPDIGADIKDAIENDPSRLAAVVMNHADVLRIPKEMDIRLLEPRLRKTVRRTDKVRHNDKSIVQEVTEYYLEYAYEQIELTADFSMGETLGFSAYGSGTLVLDRDWNAVLLATNPEAYIEEPPPDDPEGTPPPETALQTWARARTRFEQRHKSGIQQTLAARHEQRSAMDRPVVPGCPFVLQRNDTGAYRLVRRCCNLQEHIKGICFTKYGIRQP